MIATAAVTVIWPAADVSAQTYTSSVRRQWVTFSYEWLYTWPLHFDDHPLEDLVGAPVDEAEPPYDYRTRDNTTFIDVLEFKRPGRGLGMTLYPFGMSVGPALGLRASIENIPDIRIRFDGPGALDSYTLTGGVAYDIGAGVYIADRAPGWGLGSYAFINGGIGRISSDLTDGRRYFAEGGGGVQSGPVGFELSVKFGWNRFSEPVEHRFLTVPVTMRATVSF
jgi:hypothetical protein